MSTGTRRSAERRRAKSDEPGLDQRLVRALGHPLRQRILYQLGDRTASPNELAQVLDAPLGNVSYHVKILEECDAIELVRTEPVRGALEHFYRAKAVPRLYEKEWKQLPESARRALFDGTLTQAWQHILAAAKTGGFENTKSHISWTPLELDPAAYADVLEEVEGFIDRILALQVEARERLAKLPPEEREVHSTEAVLMHFHRAPDGDSSPG